MIVFVFYRINKIKLPKIKEIKLPKRPFFLPAVKNIWKTDMLKDTLEISEKKLLSDGEAGSTLQKHIRISSTIKERSCFCRKQMNLSEC